jgi:hypothetical protein
MSTYISQDFVHDGCGLILDPDQAWSKVSRSVRKNIRKAETHNIRIEKVVGSSADLELLKSMWYDPFDPNLPTHLDRDDHMFLAFDEKDSPIGACVLLPVDNHLFLNNLAGTRRGKALRIQDYLLWHCVNYFSNSDFKYIDVGVSYRRSLYKFFKKWKTISYPVIFHKPAICPQISCKPFAMSAYTHFRNNKNAIETLETIKSMSKSENITFCPTIENAKSILETSKLPIIDTTFRFPFVGSQPCLVDLTEIFSVQFGAIIFNVNVTDQEMWDTFKCFDHYKRELVLTNIYDELLHFDDLIGQRKQNYSLLSKLFELEDIEPVHRNEKIPSLFYFRHIENRRHHHKLLEFQIEHEYDEQDNICGLPIHQNLNKQHIEFMYAVFRGVLNLCSEWIHTAKYASYKDI